MSSFVVLVLPNVVAIRHHFRRSTNLLSRQKWTNSRLVKKRTCKPTWNNTHDDEREKKLVFTKTVQMVVKVSFFSFWDAFGFNLFIWLRHEMMRDELGGFLLKTGIMCRNVAILPKGGNTHLIRVATERSFGGKFDVKWRIITCANTQTWVAVNNVRDVCDYLAKVDGQFNRFFWRVAFGRCEKVIVDGGP